MQSTASLFSVETLHNVSEAVLGNSAEPGSELALIIERQLAYSTEGGAKRLLQNVFRRDKRSMFRRNSIEEMQFQRGIML
jgi:hypothetical protein